MFRLIAFFISIVGFAAVVWFGITVELGERTLFGHLRAISNSNEAQQLWDGTRSKVTDFVGIEAARRAEEANKGRSDVAKGRSDDARSDVAKGRSDVAKGRAAKGPAVERAPATRETAPTPAPAKQTLARATGKVAGQRQDAPAATK